VHASTCTCKNLKERQDQSWPRNKRCHVEEKIPTGGQWSQPETRAGWKNKNMSKHTEKDTHRDPENRNKKEVCRGHVRNPGQGLVDTKLPNPLSEGRGKRNNVKGRMGLSDMHCGSWNNIDKASSKKGHTHWMDEKDRKSGLNARQAPDYQVAAANAKRIVKPEPLSGEIQDPRWTVTHGHGQRRRNDRQPCKKAA